MTWNEDLVRKLHARRYALDDSYFDAAGKLVLVISGEGVERCSVSRKQASLLADGRVTLRQLAEALPHG